MSLNFAGISPHPPIIIPEIGKDDINKVADTTIALRKLAHDFNEAEIDTLIVISPHGLIYPDQFSICGMKKLFGSFAEFDAPNVIIENQNNLELANLIDEAAQKEGIKSLLYDNDGEFYELDHGVMVPLYYIKSQLENPIKVIPISYSNLDRAAHFSLGQIIRDVAAKYPERVGILASGDLAHQLIQRPESKEFDEKLIDDIEKYPVQFLLPYGIL